MHEANLCYKILNEIYKRCDKSICWIIEVIFEILLREIICQLHPRRVEIFEKILKGFRKYIGLIEKDKRYAILIGNMILLDIMESDFTKTEVMKIGIRKII
jgi:hypothetical protein